MKPSTRFPAPSCRHRTRQLAATLLALATAGPALAAPQPGGETAATATENASAPATGDADHRRAFLGIHPVRVSEELATHLRLDEGIGLRVEFIQPGSPAETAGLQRHDVLVALDDQWLTHPEQLSVLVGNRQVGESVTLTLIQRGERLERAVILAERPAGLAGAPGEPVVIERLEEIVEADPDSPRARLEELVEKALEKSRDRFEPAGELRQRLRETIEKALRDAGLDRRKPASDAAPAAAAESESETGAEASEDSAGAVDRGGDRSERGIERPQSSASSSVSITLGTGDGMTIRLTETNGGQRRLNAVDRDGTVLYDGPFTGDPESDGIPPKVREKLHLLENVEIRTESSEEETR